MNFIFLFLVCISAFPLVLTQRASSNAQQLCRNSRNIGSMFPHEEYCDYYYECDSNGEVIVQACPNGLVFAGAKRGLISNCDYPHRQGCPDGQRVMGQSPLSSENCHWQYGLFPHATSCTRFWHCWNATATIQSCPFSLLYNDATSQCDYPEKVKDCMAHPICKDTPNGAVPIEKSCIRYWLCIGGYPRLQRCSAGLAINPSTLKCELATTVPGCEPPPTTATNTAEGEEEEAGENNSSSGNQPSSSDNNNSNNNNSNNNNNNNNNNRANSRQASGNSQNFKPQGVRLVG